MPNHPGHMNCILVSMDCHNRAPQTGWLNQLIFFQCSGGWKSLVRVLIGLISSVAFSFSLQRATFSLLFTWSPTGYVCVLIFSFYEDTSHIALGPIHMISSYLNHLFENPVCKYSDILSYGGLGLQHINFRGTQFIP